MKKKKGKKNKVLQGLDNNKKATIKAIKIGIHNRV